MDVPHGIERERQQDREGEYREKAVQRQREGIPHKLPEHGGGEKCFEMLQADPRAGPYTPAEGKPLKGNQDAVHGDIPENDEISYRDKQKKVQLPVGRGVLFHAAELKPFFIGLFHRGGHDNTSFMGLVQQPGRLSNKSCGFSAYSLQNCCFYKKVVQQLKFLNNSMA
jgi:hypothetical protein